MPRSLGLAFRVLTVSILVLLLAAHPAFAAKKKVKTPPNSVKVNPADVFALTDAAGKSFQCVSVKGKLRAGSLKKTFFTLTSMVYAEQKKKYGKICSDKKKKNSAKYKKPCKSFATLKAQVAERDPLCKEGPDSLTQLKRPLTEADVQYLYEKAAFGSPPAEAVNIGLTQGIGPLVDYMMAVRTNPALEAEARKYLDENFATDSTDVTDEGIRQWALHLMLKSADPFNERFAFLFLHNLLATSMEVLTQFGQSPLMLTHLENIRAGARSGDYPTLLKVITRDPVMLIWLSGSLNTRQAPNENFARELMELFTLSPTNKQGQPNYSETTVAQVARACTGWKVTNDNSLCPSDSDWCQVYSAGNHDSDPNKVIFEGTAYQGVVDDDFDVIDHILANHPNAPVFLAERLLKEYLNENPSDKALNSTAKLLKANNYNFRPVLAKLLKSEEFFKDANKNSIVKGPVERLVTFLRATGIPYRFTSSEILNGSDGGRPTGLDNTGQMIGMPPTVFGWDNPDWLNGAWLLSFVNTVNRVLKQDSYFTTNSFSYLQLLPHPTATAQEVVNHWMAKLNVNLTPEQQGNVVSYMNNRLNANTTFTADPWDPTNATKVRRKVAGVLEILARSNDFQMR